MAITEEQLRTGRILMVDDVVSSLCLLEGVLTRLRFRHLRTLSDPTRILEEVDSFAPDLIFTDLDMPGMDGIQLIEAVRKHLPRETLLPIVMLTGVGNPMNRRRALLAGATDILDKPFDSSEIQLRIRNLLLARFQHIEIGRQNEVLEEKVTERTEALERALTELKDSQRQVVQQERFRAFGEMAGGVVHDFNNALTSVIGYSELLLHDDALLKDSTLVRHYLQTMNTASQDAAHVVSRLRDFYRPRKDGDVFVPVNVNDLIEEVVPLTRPKWHDQALSTGRAFQIDLELEKVPPVLGNSSELRSVITNLIFNAVDAMPGGGKITLRSKVDGNSVRIEVADTGTGMTPEVRERCLEPFFSTKNEKGTGLGLSMSFGIMRRHEGTLDIETELGKGTTFILALPSHRPLGATAEDAIQEPARPIHVLVVDDDPGAREVVTLYLQADGHSVVTASGGREAMRRIAGEKFDLVITDHGMPDMDGIHVSNEIRRTAPATPVILLSGYTMQSEQHSDSLNCILQKPIVRSTLRSAITQVLRDAGTDRTPAASVVPDVSPDAN